MIEILEQNDTVASAVSPKKRRHSTTKEMSEDDLPLSSKKKTKSNKYTAEASIVPPLEDLASPAKAKRKECSKKRSRTPKQVPDLSKEVKEEDNIRVPKENKSSTEADKAGVTIEVSSDIRVSPRKKKPAAANLSSGLDTVVTNKEIPGQNITNILISEAAKAEDSQVVVEEDAKVKDKVVDQAQSLEHMSEVMEVKEVNGSALATPEKVTKSKRRSSVRKQSLEVERPLAALKEETLEMKQTSFHNISTKPEVNEAESPTLEEVTPVSYTHLTLPTTPYV